VSHSSRNAVGAFSCVDVKKVWKGDARGIALWQ
jgi:hypothetical protein